jgi:DNA-binding transcriptional regulator YiaG
MSFHREAHPTRRDQYDDTQGMLPHLLEGFRTTSSPAQKEEVRDLIAKNYRDILELCPAADRAYWREKGEVFRQLEAKETAELMRAWREQEGLTQMEASFMTGIPVRTWQEWEQGRKPGPGVLLLRLAFEALSTRRRLRREQVAVAP